MLWLFPCQERHPPDDHTRWRQIVDDVAWLDDVKLKTSENITLSIVIWRHLTSHNRFHKRFHGNVNFNDGRFRSDGAFFYISAYARETKLDLSRIGRIMGKCEIAIFIFKTWIFSYFNLAQYCRKATRERQECTFFQKKKSNHKKIRIFWGKRAAEMDSTQNFGLEKVWLKEILSWAKMPTRIEYFGLKM